jgi:putative transposase
MLFLLSEDFIESCYHFWFKILIIQDVSMGTILTQLKYKSEWHHRDYIEVDRFFASSKRCSCCGFNKDDLLLKDRSWTCP